MINISATIITLNEAAQIENCIMSMQQVVDEIIVVDDFSEDKTAEIAARCGAKVIEHKFEDFEKQKNFAGANAQYNWILNLDADERLSKRLQESILNFKELATADACKMNRLNFIGKEAVKRCGWYPDKKLRLYNKSKAAWAGGPVHEHVKLQNGSVVKVLEGDIIHYSFKNREDVKMRLQGYAKSIAQDKYNKGKKTNLLKIYARPVFQFLKMYFLKLGFLDFKNGFFVAKAVAKERFLREKYLDIFTKS